MGQTKSQLPPVTHRLTRALLALGVAIPLALVLGTGPAPAALPDTNPPQTFIVSGPSDTIDDNTPTFEFSSDDPDATFECRVVDETPFETCTSPYTTAALANGEHTFEVRAVTAAGNTDPTPASRTFTVNAATVEPHTLITSGPSGTIDDNTPTFEFEALSPGATFECRVDDTPFETCTSPHTTAPLANGEHTFEVRAITAAGNTDPTPASRTFTVNIDTAAPQTTITNGPSGLNLSRKATFAFTSSEAGSSFECRLDGGGWQSCTSPRTYSGLGLGNHKFVVRAIDQADNVDPTPAQRTWFTLGLLPF